MIELPSHAAKVVGAKQARRALQDGRARCLLLAADADPRVTEPLVALAKERGVALGQVPTMKELGAACAISVGAAVAVLL